MIVDDNYFNILILEKYLEKMNDEKNNLFEFTILKSLNGLNCLELFKSTNANKSEKNL